MLPVTTVTTVGGRVAIKGSATINIIIIIIINNGVGVFMLLLCPTPVPLTDCCDALRITPCVKNNRLKRARVTLFYLF